MKHNDAWSEKGKRAIVKIPETRSVTHTAIDKTEEKTSKDQKSNKGKKIIRQSEIGQETNKKSPPKGATTARYIKFINKLLDIMEVDESLKRHFLVTGNDSIRKSPLMKKKIESRGYRTIYLPPYSPELNPIEQF